MEDAVLQVPIRPMSARSAEVLPEGPHWAWEPKFDGVRALAVVSDARVVLQSRQQRWLTRYFPEVVAGLAQLPAGTVLDGELVVMNAGRADFAALQRRFHPAGMHAARRGALPPAALVVFDVLVDAGQDLRRQPYRIRRQRLEHRLHGIEHPIVLVPVTREITVARAWLTQHIAAGIEGVVAKDVRHGYIPGRRSWTKIRARESTEAVVGGVVGERQRPEALLLGRPGPGGQIVVAGRTTPLHTAARLELGALLQPPRLRHPWPERIPASRFGQFGGEPVQYTPVEPLVVVEVGVDAAWEHGRWRHAARYQRLRLDLAAADLEAFSPIPGHPLA